MAIGFYDSREVYGEPGGQLECADLRIGKEGRDRRIEVGRGDRPSLDQVADTHRMRLGLGHGNLPALHLEATSNGRWLISVQRLFHEAADVTELYTEDFRASLSEHQASNSLTSLDLPSSQSRIQINVLS
jgi:hypothetical protein